MAIQTKTLSSAEHDWYATRSGQPSAAPLSQHQNAYWASKGATSELTWLATLTGVTSKHIGDMWREAVAGQSLTPSVSTSENKFIFFTQVTTSP